MERSTFPPSKPFWQTIPRVVWIRLAQIGLGVVLLTAWELIAQEVGSFILAPPTALVSAFIDMVQSGDLGRAMVDSLYGLSAGYLLAVLIGVTVGFLMGWYPSLATILNPFVAAMYVVPVAALVPLLIVWFGIGATPRIITVMLFAVFEILLTTQTAVRDIDQRLVEMARMFGANRRQILTSVVVQAALPVVGAGLRIGAGRAIKGMVVAELLFAATGLGGLVMHYSSRFQTDRIMVVVIVVAIMGVVLGWLIQRLEHWIAPWYYRRPNHS